MNLLFQLHHCLFTSVCAEKHGPQSSQKIEGEKSPLQLTDAMDSYLVGVLVCVCAYVHLTLRKHRSAAYLMKEL